MRNDRFARLVEEVDFQLAQRRHLRARGIHLIVTHLYHLPGTFCAPGEMIGDILISRMTEPISLGLSQMSLLLMDCLCRYRTPLTALRMEQIMNSDPFYLDYAANQIGNDQIIAKPDRRTARVCVPRIQKRMESVFQGLGLRVDPLQILTSEPTDSNVVIYRLKATVEIIHIDKY